MKLNLIALTSLVALTAAQSTDSTSDSATGTTVAPSATVSLSPQQSCAKKCDATDLCCIAGCFEVPCPNDSQANDTNTCVAACPQGSGTPSDTERYASCQSSCYSSHFFPITATGNSGASKTSASNSDATTTGTGKDSSSTGSSDSSGSRSSGSKSSGTGTSTGTAATGTETNAASVAKLQMGVSAAGIAGLALGIWAL
ncbi:hypothetical protein P875_00033990 [Aspergillus parasiticus SU-1]|uniref:GPI anchored serine-threonine rich protein n=3 Tax=Aspergillus subgen. Circumdati TaxID=2720871 RepID=A0A2G7FRP4_9EURO|nr:hypothetical protein BDV34DRAFT_183938 [Aspergillus parasiticus]KAE8341275.1 hypothetical protein BDV24DRAFT_132672 [Aspergillus arachidicola]KJK63164.1 hypothetical protein P875_00033990 [Aspergillus parasiticus SU-1]PIG83284.1 hypothetical protein AARAC_001151 [Aspergillus arachidicola]